MKRQIVLAIPIAVLPCLLFLPSCSRPPEVWPDKPGKKVLAMFIPLYCFAQNVAGDDANVMCLFTVKGPHEAEVSTQDILKVAGPIWFWATAWDSIRSNSTNSSAVPVKKSKGLRWVKSWKRRTRTC